MVRPSKKRARGVSKYGRGAGGYGTYINVPTAVPFRPGYDRRNVGTLHVTQGEKKFFDTAINLAVGAGAGLVEDSLCHVPIGTGPSDRIGRSITIHNINIRGIINFPEHATISADVYRLIVYLDNSANGAAATATDILSEADEKSFRNLNNNTRFLVLKDTYNSMNALTSDAGSNYGQTIHPYEFNWYSREGIKVNFNSTAGAIGELKEANIGLLWLNQGATGFIATSRIRYTDA